MSSVDVELYMLNLGQMYRRTINFGGCRIPTLIVISLHTQILTVAISLV